MKRTPVLAFCVAVVVLWQRPAFAQLSLNSEGSPRAGAVYTMTNAASGNMVVAMKRDADGNLTFDRTYATGGNGTGASLGNAGGITISPDHRLLLVVNAGSNDVSVFAIQADHLRLVDRTLSGGSNPLSITMSGDIVYVLNAGGDVGHADNISGFRMRPGGHLTALSNSTRPLSGSATQPAQVAFDPSGGVVVVTEKMTSNIDTYAVKQNGLLSGPDVQHSAGATPFGFAFDAREHLIVSNAVMGNANAGGVSSYSLRGSVLHTVTSFAPTNETAPCWVLVSGDGRYAYVTNTGSGTISGFRLGFSGALRALNGGQPLVATGPNTSAPIDMAQSHDGRYLYALDSGTGAISAFSEMANGGLQPQLGVYGFPASVDGLAAV